MRILIVDDEVIIRTGLARVIKWEELGLQLLEPAASAEEALERLPAERPNILLTDIRMTGRNGLELAEEARKLFPELEVIILSGYDDFAYTQQAIRQDVSDYLLKTSRPEEIIKAVLTARQRIEDKWAVHHQDRFIGREARSRMLERLLTEPGGALPPEEPLLRAALPGLFTPTGCPPAAWQVLLITAEGWAPSSSSEALLLFAAENMLGELLPCETLIQPRRMAAVLRLEEPELRAGALPQPLLSALRRIEQLLKCRLFTAVGPRIRELGELHTSYAAADYAFLYRGIVEEDLCDYADIALRRGGKSMCTHEEEIELSAILLEDDAVRLRSWVQQFTQEQLGDPQVTIESLESACQSVLLSAHRWLERVLAATGRAHDAGDRTGRLLFTPGESPRDLLFKHLYSLMKLYHQQLAQGQAAHVQKAKAYIEAHLGSNVGLQQVARHVHLSPNHVSEIFKKETGMTFGDYVTQRKLARAMEILSVSPAKISEVAAAVGYGDLKYFSQLFKKYTGRTPSEYREEASLTKERG